MRDGKNCQERMEEIKNIVEVIDMFQKNHPEALKIPEMSLWKKECCIRSCEKCTKRAQMFKNQASNICKICIEVGKYIEKIIEDLNLLELEVGNQIIS